MPSSSAVDRTQHRLAALAKESRLLADAQTLAEWVGTGRPLTSRRVLKPAAVVEACGVLSIDLPSRKPRSALDIDELMTVWNAAAAAGFIEFGRGQAMAGPALDVWSQGDAEAVVAVWTQAALGHLGLVGDIAEAGIERLAVLAALHERGGSAALDDLAEAMAELDGDVSDGCSCPDCAMPFDFTDSDVLSLSVGQMYAQDAAEKLAEFDVVALRGDVVELTQLGHWLTDFMFRQSAPDADVDAGSLVVSMAMLPARIAAIMFRPWLSARTPADAARELMAVAESAVGQARLTALALARECGPEAVSAWRDWATNKEIGAYARVWLAEHDGTEPADADEAWITVDTLAIALDALPPEASAEMLGPLLQAQIGAEIAEVLPQLANCGHPAGPRLVSLLTARPLVTLAPPTGPRPPVRGDSMYQVKVQLRGVTKPPVWRRLQVPADVSLDRFHEVIQHAMGWDDCHMHVFDDGSTRFGVPDVELGFQDERTACLSQLLAGVGDKVEYVYDFGDNWCHDITLEKILPADRSAAYAVCIAGKGACPPEDCGGVWGYQELKATLVDPEADGHDDMLEWLGLDSADEFDPAEFSVEDAGRGLARDRDNSR